MGNTLSNTGRGDEPTRVIRDTGSDDTKREHRPVSTESTNSEDDAGASNRKLHVKSAPESSYSYITLKFQKSSLETCTSKLNPYGNH